MVFAIFGKIAPKIQQRSPRCSKKCAKLAILPPKLAILGTSWRQVGQLGAILAPRCAPIAIQMDPQMRSKSHLGPSWRQEGHRGAQKCPWSLNFQRFLWNFQPNSIDFSSSFLQVPAASSGTVAACRAQRTGYPPPPRSGGRACVNLVPNPANSNFPTLPTGSRGVAARAQMPTAATVASIPRSTFRLPIFGQLSHNMLPRSSQLDAKIAQLRPTCDQDRRK